MYNYNVINPNFRTHTIFTKTKKQQQQQNSVINYTFIRYSGTAKPWLHQYALILAILVETIQFSLYFFFFCSLLLLLLFVRLVLLHMPSRSLGVFEMRVLTIFRITS